MRVVRIFYDGENKKKYLHYIAYASIAIEIFCRNQLMMGRSVIILWYIYYAFTPSRGTRFLFSVFLHRSKLVTGFPIIVKRKKVVWYWKFRFPKLLSHCYSRDAAVNTHTDRTTNVTIGGQLQSIRIRASRYIVIKMVMYTRVLRNFFLPVVGIIIYIYRYTASGTSVPVCRLYLLHYPASKFHLQRTYRPATRYERTHSYHEINN